MIKPIHVLIIEDNPADVDLMKESLEASKLHIELSVMTDGAESIEFLNCRGPYESVRHPDLILLDLNLPGKSGQEVLAEIKQHQNLKRIPVVVLTSSDAEKDVVKSYDLGANCYVIKPVDLKTFQMIVSAIGNLWFTVVKLPPTN